MTYPTTFPPESADASVADLSGDSCPRLSSAEEVARRLVELDNRYVRAEFVPLDSVADSRAGGTARTRELIAARRLPQPAYRLEDGTDMVPADYFALLDEAGSLDGLRPRFLDRYVRAAGALGVPSDAEAAEDQWQEYLSGGYFVCLRHPTPEDIARKAAYIIEIDDLLVYPRPDDSGWCRRVRDAVEGLAGIERPGAVLDPPRWGGPMSPQWYGAYLRAYFPTAFAGSS